MYKIYISSFNGLSYTGLWYNTEKEAKAMCDKLNKQDNNPYCQRVYKKV